MLKNPDFLIVPYVVYQNSELHRDDKFLYAVIYWFANLKNEECFASNKTLSEVSLLPMGTIKNGLTRLEKCGFIKRILIGENKKREQILPLVSFTNQSPASDGESPGRDTNPSPAEEHNNKIINNKILNKQVGELIDIFKKTINPTIKFNNKTQNQAAKDLIIAYGFEKAMSAGQYAVSVQGEKFAPTITTPYQLREKMAALVKFKLNHKKKEIIKL